MNRGLQAAYNKRRKELRESHKRLTFEEALRRVVGFQVTLSHSHRGRPIKSNEKSPRYQDAPESYYSNHGITKEIRKQFGIIGKITLIKVVCDTPQVRKEVFRIDNLAKVIIIDYFYGEKEYCPKPKKVYAHSSRSHEHNYMTWEEVNERAVQVTKPVGSKEINDFI